MEPTTLCKLMEASYHAARDLLMQAARDLDEAGRAAHQGERNQARGTAIGAETDLQKALDLIKAVGALQLLDRG
ncbi:hypothetical protein, partial [Gemmobacter denitrificans]